MRADQGSATVLGLVLMLACVVGMVVAVSLAELAGARARISAAADLAALAGAEHDLIGDQCAAAERVAQRGGARLISCQARGREVSVVAAGDVPGIVAQIMVRAGKRAPQIEVRSRAGAPE